MSFGIGIIPIAVLWLGLWLTTRAAELPALKDAYKDFFLVGVAINRPIAMGTDAQADNVNRTREQVEQDTTTVLAQFNQISPENDLKWQLIHPHAGADGFDFGPADGFVSFGLSNNLYLVGHTLVWHSQTPNWVFAGTNPPPMVTNSSGERRLGRWGYAGPRASREELLARMREHIHTVVGRYKGKIKVWDVVNEAIADGGTNVLRTSLWLEIIGPDFIARAFEFAHEADPDAILRYNDYGLENPGKRRKLITLIRELQAKKVPVHAIGTQAHLSVSSPSFDGMDEALTELATLGLPIHVTELDVNGAQGGQRDLNAEISENANATQGGLVKDANQRLADQYANMFRAFLKHKDSIKMVTLWGVNDAVSWRANGRPLLFDGKNQPKPAFDAVIRVALDAKQNPPRQSASAKP
ncbi:MAG: endo-1,4-beta-xylanase [Verrucomicrobiota bacterium]